MGTRYRPFAGDDRIGYTWVQEERWGDFQSLEEWRQSISSDGREKAKWLWKGERCLRSTIVDGGQVFDVLTMLMLLEKIWKKAKDTYYCRDEDLARCDVRVEYSKGYYLVGTKGHQENQTYIHVFDKSFDGRGEERGRGWVPYALQQVVCNEVQRIGQVVVDVLHTVEGLSEEERRSISKILSMPGMNLSKLYRNPWDGLEKGKGKEGE